MFHDLRLAFRSLRGRPGSNAAIVTILGLGIAAATVVFSLTRGLLLKPLDVPEPERLARVFTTQSVDGVQRRVTEGAFHDLRREAESFEVVVGARNMGMPITDAEEALNPLMREVSSEWFEALGATPLLGRLFSADDYRDDARRTVLSFGLWQSLYGGDPAIVGGTIELGYEAYEVVGVMSASYRNPSFPDSPVLWLPMVEPAEPDRRRTSLVVLARLRPGVDIGPAHDEVAALGTRLAARHPTTDAGHRLNAEAAHRFLVERIRPALLALLGAVAFVLLIACTNVANLLLTRSMSRRREIGVRMALGASRLRLARQLLAESAVLGLIAAGIGILIATWAMTPLLDLAPSNTNVPLLDRVAIDLPVLGFAVAAALLTSLLFGLAPLALLRRGARWASGRGMADGSSRGGRRLRGAFVVVEVALSLVLLIGAGLMVRTLANLQGIGLGFEPEHLSVARIGARGPDFGAPDRWSDFHRLVGERLSTISGVEDVAACEILPMFASFRTALPVRTSDNADLRPAELPQGVMQRTTPGFFRVFGMPLLAGRGFSVTDRAGAPKVAVISRTLATRVWGDRDPIGRELMIGPDGDSERWRIVGLVGDLRGVIQAPEPPPILYVPFDQAPTATMSYMVRTSGPPTDLAAAVEQAVWSNISRDVPVYAHSTLDQIVSDIEWQPRFVMQLLTVFALFALGLAAIGLYAVLAYAVADRRREIGVRVAVGARRNQIVGLILGSSARLTLIGVLLGLLGGGLLGRALASQLYGVAPTDPLTLILVPAVVAGVALVASLVPALAATRVDPVDALRAE